ncbi:PcfJ domain-containing protein [Paenibacillus sp. NRS-1783]|uniref:PcfJ domain-containing protein n=1 Tax=Paenibacillus sp. NRS-1783 TaxID=3233907 RepID=UPI003D26C9E0
MSEKPETKRFLAHFPDVSKELREYIDNAILPHSRYLFTKRMQGIQQAYCTHCKRQWMTDETLKENQQAVCKKCGSSCTVKASGRSRKRLRDDAYVVYYDKSQFNPKAIVARGLYVERDYRGEYRDVETKITVDHYYLFEPRKAGVMYSRAYGDSHRVYLQDHVKCEYGGYFSYGYRHWTRVVANYDSIQEAVQGTPYQYSTWEQYNERDMVRFFDLYSQYPCVEYLTKLGMKYFVEAKLYSMPTFNAINWRGKSIEQVLKLCKQQINEIRDYPKNELHPLTLRLQQIIRQDGSALSLQELNVIAKLYESSFSSLKKILKYASLIRVHNYIQKQYRLLQKSRENRRSIYEVISTWKDYIADCETLQLDIKNDFILFPKELHEAHQHTIRMVKVKVDEILNEKLSRRLQSLKKYCFQSDDFFIRPAASSKELIEEGKVLQHCVGRYVEDYAKGKTSLFVVRRKSEPEKPFYTMEIRKNVIFQTRGLKNAAMTDEVQHFVEEFKKIKLDKREDVAV